MAKLCLCYAIAANGEIVCASRKPKCAFPCSGQDRVSYCGYQERHEQDTEVILYYLMSLLGAGTGTLQEKGFLPG